MSPENWQARLGVVRYQKYVGDLVKLLNGSVILEMTETEKGIDLVIGLQTKEQQQRVGQVKQRLLAVYDAIFTQPVHDVRYEVVDTIRHQSKN